jgi:hypothetical protein
MRQGLVFVHGINQSAGDLAGMDEHVHDTLARWRVAPLFTNVWPAKWRSTGNFEHDLEVLSRFSSLRDWAVRDVASKIQQAVDQLDRDARESGDDQGPSLVVVGHSMGQVLACLALDQLGQAGLLTMPVGLVTYGGPLGNANPLYDRYLRVGVDGIAWGKTVMPERPAGVACWVDVFNPLDPICHDPILGSRQYPGSQHEVFRAPDQPDFLLPFQVAEAMRYHGRYFDHESAGRPVEQVASRIGLLALPVKTDPNLRAPEPASKD